MNVPVVSEDHNGVLKDMATLGLIKIASIEDYISDDSLRTAWAKLLASNLHAYSIYQSIDWWEHLVATRPAASLRLGVLYAEDARVIGIVPVELRNYSLQFDALRRTFLTWPLRAAHLLGGVPLLPPDESTHQRFYAAILEALPEIEAIYAKGVPTNGTSWSVIQNLSGSPGAPIVYAESGVRPFYAARLPAETSAYFARFSRKTRYNLRRQARLLDKHSGPLSVIVVESAEQVAEFVQGATEVAARSWQRRQVGVQQIELPGRSEQLVDLAQRGLLRSYLLKAGAETCAFVVGYQWGSVFHYAEVGYDQRFAEFSPGTVLLTRVIEDLINRNRLEWLNFGIGDTAYKRLFGTEQCQEGSVLLLRNRPRERVMVAGHSSFRSLSRGAKSLLHLAKRGFSQPA